LTLGEGATKFAAELEQAKQHFPSITFRFPGSKELKMMRRDLADAADKRLRTRRLLEQLQEELSPEELTEELRRMENEGRRSHRKQGWEG
jgi:hypothetical protein